MKYIIIILSLILFIDLTYAVPVDDGVILSVLNGSFNYSFQLTSIDFDKIVVSYDYIQLNYTNITIIPYSGTGNATIYQTRQDYINFTLCGQDQNMNMSFQNLTGYLIYKLDDIQQSPVVNNSNYTINATSNCRIVTIERDTTQPVITIAAPTSETTTNHTPLLNVSVDDVSNITYSIDGGDNITLCTSCTSNNTVLSHLTSIAHTIDVYAINNVGLLSSKSVSFTIFDIGVESSPSGTTIAEEEVNVTNITYEILNITKTDSFLSKVNLILDYNLARDGKVCLGKTCQYSFPLTLRPFVYIIVIFIIMWIIILFIKFISSKLDDMITTNKVRERELISNR